VWKRPGVVTKRQHWFDGFVAKLNSPEVVTKVGAVTFCVTVTRVVASFPIVGHIFPFG
jgi:hypothetical protein